MSAVPMGKESTDVERIAASPFSADEMTAPFTVKGVNKAGSLDGIDPLLLFSPSGPITTEPFSSW